MRKKYRIIYLPIFYKDLSEIINYIILKLDNSIAAKKLLDRIQEEINKRSINPEYYEQYYSSRKRKQPYYRIYIKNYIVFYTINGDVIEVRRILYNKQNYKNIL